MSTSIYDRQLDTDLFKRLHQTNFTLILKKPVNKILGPGSYNPSTIDEIYRQKPCSKYGPYYQQSKYFCPNQISVHGLGNVPDELLRKNEFKRRYNSIRLDRQSHDICRKRKLLVPRAPPVTLYEKSSFVEELRRKQTGIYGPYVRLAQDHSNKTVDWYKGPARLQDKSLPSNVDLLFSKSNSYKGKFLPLPSTLSRNKNNQLTLSPGPTTYFSHAKSSKQKSSSIGFLSSTERFKKSKLSISYPGPATYKPDNCIRKKTKINRKF